jgi:NAD-dependent SIR2 family protein deacetylase
VIQTVNQKNKTEPDEMKKYKVVERFKENCYDAVYERFKENGRMLPEGLHYLNSWVSKENDVCYQLMETSNPELFTIWNKRWEDLIDFEIEPVD